MTSQIHLENFVESSATLPAELVRLLATIKDLDERSQSMSLNVVYAVLVVLATEHLQSAVLLVVHDAFLGVGLQSCWSGSRATSMTA